MWNNAGKYTRLHELKLISSDVGHWVSKDWGITGFLGCRERGGGGQSYCILSDLAVMQTL